MKRGSPEWFKASREKLGLTQSEIAIFLGYSSGQLVSNLERGRSKRTALAQALLVEAYLSGYRPKGWPQR